MSTHDMIDATSSAPRGTSRPRKACWRRQLNSAVTCLSRLSNLHPRQTTHTPGPPDHTHTILHTLPEHALARIHAHMDTDTDTDTHTTGP